MCVCLQEEKREQKFADIITAIVQSVKESCSCTFSQANVQNREFSCRSIENTVVFRAEIIYDNPEQNGYRARDLVKFVSAWAQRGTSIVVDSTRLDVDPACPTQLESLQDGDCEVSRVEATTVNTEATITPTVNTIIFSAAIGGGCLTFLLVIFIIVMAIILVRCKRRKESDKRYDNMLTKSIPYSAKFSRVFNFANFANFQLFAKIFQQKFLTHGVWSARAANSQNKNLQKLLFAKI